MTERISDSLQKAMSSATKEIYKRRKSDKKFLKKVLKTKARDLVRYNPRTGKWLDGLSANDPRVRTMTSIYEQFISDLGGMDYVTTAQREIAKRCAGLATLAQDLEIEIARGSDDRETFERYIVVSRSLAMLLKIMGMERVMKDSNTITLDQYLSSLTK